MRSGRCPTRMQLRLAHFGWGFGDGKADVEYLEAVLSQALTGALDVVEAGSGLSTVLLDRVLRPQQRLLSLEHSATWVHRTNASCRFRDPVVLCPLVESAGYDWYALPAVTGELDVGLFVCDGPPASTRGGRYGALPELRGVLRPGATVLLDDAHRPAEAEILSRWHDEFGLTYDLRPCSKGAYAQGLLGRSTAVYQPSKLT